MQKTIELEDGLDMDKIFLKQKKREDIDRKVEELLNFQYSIITKLNEVIRKISL